MDPVYLDTHVAIWLYAGELNLFPKKVLEILDTADLYISPMVLLEIQYLKEFKKINFKVDRFLQDMYLDMQLKLCEQKLIDTVLFAVKNSWTRDPFDRIIVGHADCENAMLITKDRNILKNYPHAFWK